MSLCSANVSLSLFKPLLDPQKLKLPIGNLRNSNRQAAGDLIRREDTAEVLQFSLVGRIKAAGRKV